MHRPFKSFRYSVRTLLRSPGFTSVAIITLALGIGANTAIFSVVNGVLLRPLPYPDADRLMQIWQIGESGGQSNLSHPNFQDLQAETTVFEGLAEYSAWTTSVLSSSEATRVPVAVVSSDFFNVLGVSPAAGRTFAPDEQTAPVAVVSYGYWQRWMAADPDLSGESIAIDNRSYSIVGVMPAGYGFPGDTEVWLPSDPSETASRTAHNWHVVGRLADGISLSQARQEVSAIAARLKQRYGDDTRMTDAAVIPLREEIVGDVRPALLILLGAAGLLLLISCANVTNLLLARAATRQRETSVRLALGAGRARLVKQFITESMVLALAGGALGVLLSFWGVETLLALETGDLPRLSEVGVSWPVLVFALAISLLAATVMGLVTALRATSGAVSASLAGRQRTQAGGGASGQRMRGVLVVGQVAMTVILLSGAGLLARSFLRVLAVDPGYRTENGLVVDLSLQPPTSDDDAARQAALYENLYQRLEALPTVQSVGSVNAFPLSGGGSNGMFLVLDGSEAIDEFTMEDWGRLSADPERTGYAEFRTAGGEYFRTMGIPLVRGRLFDERDAPNAPHVAVISASLAQARWPNEDPIGKLIEYGNMDGDVRPFRIVGIVGDIRERSLESEPRPTFYGNSQQRQSSLFRSTLVLSTTADPASIIPSVRAIISNLEPRAPLSFRTLDEVFSASLADRRFSLILLGVFGLTALLLAMMGIYGVVSYLVAQRTQEIGIRMALGAASGSVVRMIVAGGARLVGLGLVAGLAGAIVATRVLASVLYGVQPADPTTLIAVSALLASVALLASWIPARRAARVDAMIALRSE
ncbi:MAG TPA: ABC transporter permease [Longimicrobiaceae bacterium]|nr:ABC transporter permease [Longimicrobiaceae bacterium]